VSLQPWVPRVIRQKQDCLADLFEQPLLPG